MGPNSGGGRRNQGASNVPTRAIFSNKGLASGKGKDGKGKEKGKREPRQNFQSQKEMDKAKGKGKTSSNLSPAEAHIAAAAARASGGIQQEAISIWERGVDPSYIHGCFYLTRDDHLALEPLLTPLAEAVEETVEQLSSDTVETAQDHLKELGFQSSQSNTALGVVGSRLSKECRERDLSVTDKAAAERALEYMCCTSAEGELPSKLREPREVTAARKLQEERNVSFQTKALLQGGQIEGTFITRIEKLGFSRARAIQALAEAPDHQLLPAVKSLLSEFLPLDLPPGVDADSVVPASAEELNDEIEAMRSIYGDDEVQTFGQAGLDGFELLVKLPAVSGGGRWTMAFMIPGGLLYPHVSPLLCPRHERLREANRPRLMEALGEICQQALGSPMIFILCEWLQENGPRFLVRGEVEKQETPDSEAVRISQRDNAVNRAMEESQAKAQQDEEAASERSKRCEYLQQLMAEESKPKDKIAAEIRATPETAQFDLAGYDEPQVKALVKEAFGTPFDISKMIRVTFIVGGGKAIRGKYSESLARVFGTALQDLGFNQDSAASCDLMSAGSFKGQHDTQRNLKLVHVFPKVNANGIVAPRSGGPETVAETCQRVVSLPWTEFVEEVGPWIRSRDSAKIQALLVMLEELLEELQETELSFQQGKQVSEPRRRRYDEFGSSDEVSERLRWLRNGLESSQQITVKASEGDVDGATLAFDAPSLTTRLQEAPLPEASQGTEEVNDDLWLQRRLEQTRNESDKLKKELSSNRPLQAIRESLPAYAQRSAIQEAVQDSPVVVIEGDTGCGKSTQVPQFIFEDWLVKGHAGAANIIMTQPRRISAIGVADRIANEMNTGLGDLVGYAIRLESKRSFQPRSWFAPQAYFFVAWRMTLSCTMSRT